MNMNINQELLIKIVEFITKNTKSRLEIYSFLISSGLDSELLNYNNFHKIDSEIEDNQDLVMKILKSLNEDEIRMLMKKTCKNKNCNQCVVKDCNNK